jgi:hypothetical protein
MRLLPWQSPRKCRQQSIGPNFSACWNLRRVQLYSQDRNSQGPLFHTLGLKNAGHRRTRSGQCAGSCCRPAGRRLFCGRASFWKSNGTDCLHRLLCGHEEADGKTFCDALNVFFAGSKVTIGTEITPLYTSS